MTPVSAVQEARRSQAAQLRLTDALEQLRVAEEELRAQNEELIVVQTDLMGERARYRDLFELAPQAYVTTDTQGKITEANVAACDFFNLPAERLIGKLLLNFIAPSARARFRRIISNAARSGHASDDGLALMPRESPGRYATVTVNSRMDAGPRPSLLRLFGDVSARVEEEDKLRHVAEELERRVDERTRELLAANAAKDEFLGMISHELRTPITTIYGNAEILRKHGGALSSEDRDRSVLDIESEASRLHTLIEDLLVLARLDKQKSLDLEPVLVHHAAAKLAAAHTAHTGRPVETAFEADLPPAHAEPTYVDQILRNLISNADKYSPANAPIDISGARAADEIVIRVSDRGNGIAESDRERIFESFYRAAPTAMSVSGAGVGLAVCRRLVEAQGGTIRAEARPGGGSTFIVALPVAEEWAT